MSASPTHYEQGYRLVKKKWAYAAFDGEGAKRHGGRFNSKGKACVYVSASESLAILEVLAHLDYQDLLEHYALFTLPLPTDDMLQLAIDDLPTDWRSEPAPPETAFIGDQWLDSQSSLVLAVPSVIVPREYNYLINPAHPKFAATIGAARELEFTPDTRLYNPADDK